MDYDTLKTLHLTFVSLSLAGFLVRYVLAEYRPALLQRRLLRVLPHVNDTLRNPDRDCRKQGIAHQMEFSLLAQPNGGDPPPALAALPQPRRLTLSNP